MAFINFLDVLYPVGSVYWSTASISPASLIGGTWTQLKGGLVAANGSTSFSTSTTSKGSKKLLSVKCLSMVTE